jgi:arsenate reductase
MSTRIVFVCTGNSARSQMAEGLARTLAAPGVEVASAGTHPVAVNPLAVEAMRDRGIDISGQRSKKVDEVPGEFDYVVTLCDDAAGSCPALAARRVRLHWSLPDPGAATGNPAEGWPSSATSATTSSAASGPGLPQKDCWPRGRE